MVVLDEAGILAAGGPLRVMERWPGWRKQHLRAKSSS
jgi:hypothetical protein